MINSIRIGLFLSIRQIKRANIWTTLLIVFIMMLTFLNLVGVSGILVGLIEGSIKANREQYSGNVVITTPSGENFIENGNDVLRTLKTIPEISHFSPRFTGSATIEGNYQTRRDPEAARDTVGAQIAGIEPQTETEVTNLSKYVVEGNYLDPHDDNKILLGSNLLHRYSAAFGDTFATLEGIYPGDKVKLSYGDKTKEYIVKGIVKSKVDQTSIRAFMTREEFIRFFDRTNLNVNEVAVLGTSGLPETVLKNILLRSGLDAHAKIQTADEAIPKFLDDIKLAFNLLGNIIGGIGIIVASITIFIIIFINAVTRRKYIGILKAIGVEARSIQLAYIFQSIFYAVSGALLGIIILYGLMVPAINAHPINFPFSDGILVAPFDSVMFKFVLLLVVTILAGFIPASMIVKKNTLDSILGR
jgi:ABC-type lipoprotein release transport system permease subunit